MKESDNTRKIFTFTYTFLLLLAYLGLFQQLSNGKEGLIDNLVSMCFPSRSFHSTAFQQQHF